MFKVFVLFVAIVAIANAGCNVVNKKVSTSEQLASALQQAAPGWNIILAKGNYSTSDRFVFSAQALENCPITITSETPLSAIISSNMLFDQASFVTISDVTLSTRNVFYGCLLLNDCSNVTIEGIHVTGAEGFGIRAVNSKYITIRKSAFDGLLGGSCDAIQLAQTSMSTVEQCTFGDNLDHDYCINVNAYSCSNLITDNKFSGINGTTESWIFVSNWARNNEISHNEFKNPDDRKMQYGIYFQEGSSDNIVKTNTMAIKTFGYGYAFRVGDSKQHICASNTITGTIRITDGDIDLSC